MMQRKSPFLSLVLVFSALLTSCGDSGPATPASPAAAVLAPATGSISLLAGGLGGSGNRDANGNDARFYQPMGVAVAADGTRYLADGANHTIRKISTSGDVTTLAGEPGVAGSSDGVGVAAHFRTPAGVAVGSDGAVYVADSGNYVVRRIETDGTVSTLAGLAGSAGWADGNGATARFRGIFQLTFGSDGNLYVADPGNHVIRCVTLAGDVTTIAGQAGTAGFQDGSGTAARFNSPAGIASAGVGLLYVADAGNNRIRQVTLAGDVSPVAGGSSAGWIDGDVSSARFNYPVAVAVAADGTAYVSDFLNHVVRKIDTGGQVSTPAGMALTPGSVDGTGSVARFNFPSGLAIDPGNGIWVADFNNNTLRHVSDAGVVTTPIGLAAQPDMVDDTGSLARFADPAAIAAGPDGAIYVADTTNHVIRKVDAAGVTTTFAGIAGVSGSVDGNAGVARFNLPVGIAAAADGTVYVADSGNHLIRKITSAGVVSTLAGGSGLSGFTDGTGTAARFSTPLGVAVDAAGNVYVADSGNSLLRKITPAGAVTTLAGVAGAQGALDGTGSAARFNSPEGVTVDTQGNVYVADSANHTIRKVTPAGVVTTLAGSASEAGAADGSGSNARFRFPVGIAVDTNFNLYVSDVTNHTLRMVAQDGTVSTIAGVAGVSGVVQGALPGGLNLPFGLTIGMDGALYTSSENAVLKVTLPTPAPLFNVAVQAASTSIYLGQDVSLRWAATDAINCMASGDWSGARAAAGTATVTPGAIGTFTYTLDCAENGGGATGSASVTVTVADAPPTVTLNASASAVASGSPLTLTWSSTSTTSCVASGDWSGSRSTSGSEVLTPAEGSYSYTLTCTGTAGTQAKTVSVRVMGPPTVSLSVTPATLTLGQSLVLSWSSTNSTSCTASGAWAGVRAGSGSTSLTPAGTGTYQYILSCSGPAGTVSDTASVQVNPVAQGASGGGGGGGGGGAFGLGELVPLALLALLRRQHRRAD